MPVNTDEEDVIKAIREHCVTPSKLEVVLLERNLETVIETVVRVGPQFGVTFGEDAARRAIEKKRGARLHRDRILGLSGAAQPRREALRSALLNEMPSLQHLVELIVDILSEEDT